MPSTPSLRLSPRLRSLRAFSGDGTRYGHWLLLFGVVLFLLGGAMRWGGMAGNPPAGWPLLAPALAALGVGAVNVWLQRRRLP